MRRVKKQIAVQHMVDMLYGNLLYRIIYELSEFQAFALSLSSLLGSCATTMAANIIRQPIISLKDIVSPKIIIPAITAKTDSRHNIIEAIVGSVSACATIWSV